MSESAPVEVSSQPTSESRPRRSPWLWLPRFLASLQLTVVLFAFSILLIFTATLAQREAGIWHVMEAYFKPMIAWVEFRIFLPRGTPASGSFPIPGGATLGVLLLINLLAAHSVRFKMKARGGKLALGLVILMLGVGLIYLFHYVDSPHRFILDHGLPVLFGLGAMVYLPLMLASWLLFDKKLGIVLVHGSLILLIVGEAIALYLREEAQLVIREGETVSWKHDIREAELAIIIPSEGEDSEQSTERVIAIPQSMIAKARRTQQPIMLSDLMLKIEVDAWFPNASIFALPEGPNVSRVGDTGVALEAGVRGLPRASGVGDQRVDMPAAVIRIASLKGSGQRDQHIAQMLVSAGLQNEDYQFLRQAIEHDDQTYEVVMRFKRIMLPAEFTLLDFQHDLYPGTTVPSNFSSDIRLVNHDTGEDRELRIFMNNPLRYQEMTYYQAGFLEGNHGTILQVVDNPAADLPYIACIAGGLGLAIHFVMSLTRFLGKQSPRKRDENTKPTPA